MGQENARLLRDLLANRGQLLQQLQEMREDTAGTRPEPEEWSTVEVLLHVADVDELAVRRFGEIRSGKPAMSGYNTADWEKARTSAQRDGLAGVLLRLHTARQEMLQAVSDLSDADLEKAASHPRYGQMTIRQVIEMGLRHDLDHAQQIAKTRAAVEK